MPQREEFFAQPPLELLRQYMDHGGWYDRRGQYPFRELVDMFFAAAMAPPGGGRNPTTPRLLRHYSPITFTDISTESLAQIFGAILGCVLDFKGPIEIPSAPHRCPSSLCLTGSGACAGAVPFQLVSGGGRLLRRGARDEDEAGSGHRGGVSVDLLSHAAHPHAPGGCLPFAF